MGKYIESDNGGDYAPGFDDVHGLGLKPAIPATGPAAVNLAEAQAEAAFNRIGNVGSDYVEAPVEASSELSKSIGERSRPMAGEKLSRQPVRPGDI